jgi:hypothetical protein
MEWMDRARRAGGLGWVAAGLVFQLAYALLGHVVPGAVTMVLAGVVLLLALVVAVRMRPPVVWLAGWVTAVLLALDFAGAVADRFGVFGGPGASGVSWGSWPAFVGYTGSLLPWLSHPLVVLAAVLATAAEIVLALWLISGRRRRWAGKAAAGLLVVYGLAMAFTVGPDDLARYALPLVVGGALLVSSTPVGNIRPGPVHA